MLGYEETTGEETLDFPLFNKWTSFVHFLVLPLPIQIDDDGLPVQLVLDGRADSFVKANECFLHHIDSII